MFETPSDLFENKVNESVIQTSVLNQGDCLYIPAFHWFQSENTSSNPEEEYYKSGHLTFNFKVASELNLQVIKSLIFD